MTDSVAKAPSSSLFAELMALGPKTLHSVSSALQADNVGRKPKSGSTKIVSSTKVLS